ncbi:hypothetical protein COCCADRAFT_84475 [Bipolaris zeicola 26-R-13]|uniref:Uncharacterized protein n=1 Tax=Cochliobolus carbonum (strain 26-R-13) TaxID=930089 RepID=W6Z2J1_COCC2|nr:uncharacterized protein COCCADRAFT_84475 [Bipolaris zeicola 26-R-13]EUC37891.1 hypothetical protein COCCADRAFT_84475 [Bipolaris zeicola 26-R-13]
MRAPTWSSPEILIQNKLGTDGPPTCASRPQVFTTIKDNAKRPGKSADSTPSISLHFEIECIKKVEFVPPRRSKSG